MMMMMMKTFEDNNPILRSTLAGEVYLFTIIHQLVLNKSNK